jgi:DNA polymerase III subunit epsilon
LRVAIVDTETTGLGSYDEPISVGILLLEIDPAKGLLLSEIDRYYGLRYPGVEIHPRAQAVHGFSRQQLLGQSFDAERIRLILQGAQVLVAHNSAFDARMMKSIVPEIAKMPWLCTYSRWPWPPLTDRKLDTVCAHFGISRLKTHGALDDCQLLRDALLEHTGKTTRSRTYFGVLLSKRTHTHEYDTTEPSRNAVTITIQSPQLGQTQDDGSSAAARWFIFCLLAVGIFVLILWFSSH